jgi:arsenite methyltransferase
VACGKGTTAVFLAKEFGCEVFGVDYGNQNIEVARSLAQTEHVESLVQFKRSDAETLPFSDESFDAVICECAFCTFPDKAAAAREFFRVLRRGGRVGISDLTRSAILPKDLDGLLAWVACIGDAQTVDGYLAYLRDAGFSVDSIEQWDGALKEMVDQVRMKLLGAEIMAGLNKLQLPGIDLGAAKRMASSAMTAVKQGQLGYVLICATKPDWRWIQGVLRRGATRGANRMARKIIVYSQPGWVFCTKVKEYLSQKQISFEDRDITTHPAAISELQKLGFMTTPVTVVDEKVIVGFDVQKLDEALALVWAEAIWQRFWMWEDWIAPCAWRWGSASESQEFSFAEILTLRGRLASPELR